jgi:ABC-type multidrug transport system fused ATPase/permease subunit
MTDKQTETSGIKSTAEIRQTYARRAEQFRADTSRLGRQIRALRLVLAASGIGLIGVLFTRVGFDLVPQGSALIAGVLFFVAVFATPILFKRQSASQFARRMAEVNLQSLARIDRDWNRVPIPCVTVPADRIALSKDLDLFGPASLCQLVCRARTAAGIECVANWLSVPTAADAIERRQQAVRELAPNLEYRQKLEATASLLGDPADQSQRFETWIRERSDELWLRVALWTARVLTTAAVAALLWFTVSEGDRMTAGLVLTGAIFLNIVFSIAFLGRIHTVFAVVSDGAEAVARYRRLIDAACELTPAGAELVELHTTVLQAKRGMVVLQRLTWLSRFQNLKFAILFAASIALFLLFLIYVTLQFVLLWDFHVAGALAAWRRRYATAVDAALAAVGQLEAIASLASVAAEHPDWAFARIRTDGDRTLQAQGLGHPLLHPDSCVRNDVTVGPRGTVLLVTGSNMSGKSTLLRALGTNVLLAQAGAPVCARSLVLPPLEVATVMRVTDSLEAGVSLFMAELLGMRRVVDAADRASADSKPVLFFLLDEILLGTNNAERQMAAAAVLSYLMKKNAIGAVSTHDLDLVTHPSIAAGFRPVYFRESFVTEGAETRMVFDYLMRSGVAPTTNVPFLLKAVGLPLA